MERLTVIIVLGLVLILSACGGDSPSADAVATLEPVPAEYAGKTNPLGPEAAADGEKVFKANCASCHGNEGRGDGPASGSLNPKPKDLSVLQKSVGDDYLFWRTNEGKPGTSMLPWRGVLSEEQIWQVVAFLRTLE